MYGFFFLYLFLFLISPVLAQGMSQSAMVLVRKRNKNCDKVTTLATVQCCNELASHGRGLNIRLGTLAGTFFGTEYESAVHTSTISGTP